MRKRWVLCLGSAAVLLGGCATLPTGPSVMALPAPGKPFEQFQAEDATCRQWAAQQVGGQPGAPTTQNTAVGAAVGTAIGAGLGAGLGALVGHAGTGAAIGAGTGLLTGGAAGANADQVAGWNAQRRYDMAYQQCMYAKGNQVPGFQAPDETSTQPTGGVPPPPPPPGYSPAPPGPPPYTLVPPPSPPDETSTPPSSVQSDPLVADIQTELARLGLLTLTGPPDGILEPRTQGAIRTYEKMRGLPIDGKPTQALLDDLRKN